MSQLRESLEKYQIEATSLVVGGLTIERKVSGPQQLEDARKEKQYLKELIG